MNFKCSNCIFENDCESEKECLLLQINRTNFSFKKEKSKKIKKYKKERQLKEEGWNLGQ